MSDSFHLIAGYCFTCEEFIFSTFSVKKGIEWMRCHEYEYNHVGAVCYAHDTNTILYDGREEK